jgi:hypothetical protein
VFETFETFKTFEEFEEFEGPTGDGDITKFV